MSDTNDWYLNIDKGKFAGLILSYHRYQDSIGELLLLSCYLLLTKGSWLSSYYHKKIQFNTVNRSFSDICIVYYGVAQG